MTRVNAYSDAWHELFLTSVPVAQTEREVAFLCRHLPRGEFRSILDLACGTGRHANRLGAFGYRVLGIDRDPNVVTTARAAAQGEVTFEQGDLLELSGLPRTFDAAVSLWQSFGYFDGQVNRKILLDIATRVRVRGRVVFDVYNRDFFGWRDTSLRMIEKGTVTIGERRSLSDRRLRVELRYGESSEPELFEWEVLTPAEFEEAGQEAGLQLLVVCTAFDEHRRPSDQSPRMQLVFERVG